MDALTKTFTKNEVIDNRFELVDFDPNHIRIYHNEGGSGKYKSIPIHIRELTSEGGEDTYFISIKAGETGDSKVLVPNKIIKDDIGKYLRNDSLSFNLPSKYSFLKDIYDQAIKSAKGTLQSYTAMFTPKPNTITRSNASAILNDFGEVLSAGCLATVLGEPCQVYFPIASNEPLTDFTVVGKNGEIRVSQKAGSGATPSCEAISKLIHDTKNINIKAVLSNYSDIERQNVIDFNN